MKYGIRFYGCLVFLLACNNEKVSTDTNVTAPSNQSGLVRNSQETSADAIAGYWKLKLEAYDENGNKKLDEAEKKKGVQNRYSFRFFTDGTCKIQEVFNGRYERKSESGSNMLYIYRRKVQGEEDQDPPPDIYYIIALDKNELVLLDKMIGLVFWVFGRAE